MLFINALIFGGALIASAKLYEKNKRGLVPRSTAKAKVSSAAYAQSVSVIRGKKKEGSLPQNKNWLRSDLRHIHLKTLSEDEAPVEKQEMERNLDRTLVITTGTLVLSGVGALGFPLLRLLSLPGILYGLWPIYKEAYHSAIKTGKINLSLFYAFAQTVELASGLLFITTLGNLWFLLSNKLMVIAKERYRQNLHDLFEDLPTTVYVLIDGIELERPLIRWM